MTAVIILAVIAALVLLVFLIPVSASVYVSYNNSDISKELYLKILGIRLRRTKKDRRKGEESGGGEPEPEKENGPSSEELIAFVRENLTDIKELIYAVLGYMFRHLIKIRLLSLRTVIGTDDAMETAMLYGAEAAFVYNVVGVMDRHMRLKEHRVDLKPDFNDPNIFIEFETIISTNIYHLAVLGIIAIRKGLPLYRKLRRI